jgi:hypothetical protein
LDDEHVFAGTLGSLVMLADREATAAVTGSKTTSSTICLGTETSSFSSISADLLTRALPLP